MKVAIYVQQLCFQGGIERVVRELTRIFQSHQVECQTFGSVGVDFVLQSRGVERQQKLTQWLQTFQPDVCIFNGVVHREFNDDVAVLNRLGIPKVAVCHFSFPSMMLLDGDELANQVFLEGAKRCELVATVSAIDAQWWRALGCPAVHVQNPFVHPKMNAQHLSRSSETAPRKVLWVGRQAQQKQPSAALAAFAAVTRAIPDAHLTMIGGSDAGWKRFRQQAKRLGLTQDQVTFLSERDDISDFWEAADIHLLSSVTESFCLVLAEAKSWGKPTVMFEIPFLELVESGEGLISVPQGDIQALADGIIRLMKQPALCKQLGVSARESLKKFNDEAVWQSWQYAFQTLVEPSKKVSTSPELKIVASQIMFAWQDFYKRNFWAIRFVREWQLLFRCSLMPIARVVSMLVLGIRGVRSVCIDK